MNKQKKIFLVIAAIFFLIILVILIDIGSRTTFPGQQKNNTETNEKLQERELQHEQ